jgi:hypothetical protein
MNQTSFIYLPNSSKHIDYSNQMIIEDDLLQEIKKDMKEDDQVENLHNINNSLSSVLNQIELIKDLFISIDISNNRLLDKGLLLLADSLEKNNNLKYISIANNRATRSGIFDFVIKILTFPVIPYVDIRGNFGSDLQCIKKILENLDKEKEEEFKKKIIWYGKEEFNLKL